MTYETAVKRAGSIRRIRDFFQARGVLEVETPVLSHGSPTDCHIDLFSTEFHPDGYRPSAQSERVYLQSSPEFPMKRLLAAGYGDLFQICKVFRNGERGKIHNPEFSMLEWYRKGFSMDDLIEETTALLKEVIGDTTRVLRKSYAEIFIESTGIDPLTAATDAVVSRCRALGKTPPAPASLTDALQFAMAELVEPKLPPDAVVVVYDYPAAQAVFAVLDQSDRRIARRFEAYYGGIELVNGFEELADWKETERRMLEENAKRCALEKPELPADRFFIDALRRGLPPCSGAALGLDRLIMLALGKKTIDEVLTFPWEVC